MMLPNPFTTPSEDEDSHLRFLKSVQFIPKASGIRTQSDCSRDILMKLPGWAVYQRLMETSGGRMSSNSC